MSTQAGALQRAGVGESRYAAAVEDGPGGAAVERTGYSLRPQGAAREPALSAGRQDSAADEAFGSLFNALRGIWVVPRELITLVPYVDGGFLCYLEMEHEGGSDNDRTKENILHYLANLLSQR